VGKSSLLFPFLCLWGCAPNYVHVYSKIDPDEHKIYIPTRYQGIGSEKIKHVLRDQGWEILDIGKEEIVAKAKARGAGNFEDFAHLKSSDDHPMGYRLLIRHRDNSLLTTFSFDVSSVISIIDIKTDEKVVMVAGRGDGLVNEFEKALFDADH
jgi:hypothetical protein